MVPCSLEQGSRWFGRIVQQVEGGGIIHRIDNQTFLPFHNLACNRHHIRQHKAGQIDARISGCRSQKLLDFIRCTQLDAGCGPRRGCGHIITFFGLPDDGTGGPYPPDGWPTHYWVSAFGMSHPYRNSDHTIRPISVQHKSVQAPDTKINPAAWCPPGPNLEGFCQCKTVRASRRGSAGAE